MTLATTWAASPEAHILIDLFADHTAEEIKTAEGQRLIAGAFQFAVAEYSDRIQRPSFREPFVKLLEIRKRVDLIADNFPGNSEAQFRKATALLKKYRKQIAISEMRIAYKFIERALAPGWSQDLKEKCASISQFFEKYMDYFLSYTNKRADQINADFTKAFYPETKALLRTFGMTANLLARQIIEHLSGLSGFYDKKNVELGDKIREEIVGSANSSLVFLQIVSRVMLDPGQDEEQNWCFQEYIAYKDDNFCSCSLARGRVRLFIFLIAEKSVRGNPAEAVRPFADLRDAYKPWHDHMLELATMTLETTALERSSREKLKEQIEAVAQKIHAFRHLLLDSVVYDEFAADLAY